MLDLYSTSSPDTTSIYYSPSPKLTKFPGSYTPTPVSATSTSSLIIPILSLILSDTILKCRKFYYVVKGDGCPAIAKKYRISLDSIRYALYILFLEPRC